MRYIRECVGSERMNACVRDFKTRVGLLNGYIPIGDE